MKLCYVDETGTDGRSPLFVMVGVVADSQRLRRTQLEFENTFAALRDTTAREIPELKSKELYRGNGPWNGVPGETRHAIITDFCAWLCRRKHSLALAAIDCSRFNDSPLNTDLDIWMTGALHIALQLQKAHQSLPGSKGSTFLVFDEHQRHATQLPSLLFDPPSWTDDFYERKPRDSRLDQIIDTAFYAKSHHVGLVQLADLFSFIFRRYAELADYGESEEYEGEAARLKGWSKTIGSRLLPRSSRWPKKGSDAVATWLRASAPPSLLSLS